MGLVEALYLLLRVFIVSRATLAAENLALRQQLSVLKRKRDAFIFPCANHFENGRTVSLSACLQDLTAMLRSFNTRASCPVTIGRSVILERQTAR